MLMKTIAHDIHMNAVEHGWWEEEMKLPEIIALVHSEWSEALEEARAGRPMVWYACTEGDEHFPCAPADESECLNFDDRFNCKWRSKKPEGVAVELIDGVIRILDFIGYLGAECIHPDTGFPADIEYIWGDDPALKPDEVPDDVPTLIAYLHAFTSEVIMLENFDDTSTDEIIAHLVTAACFALVWVHKQGIDPLKLLLEKHEYNKTRPYKHGKKF